MAAQLIPQNDLKAGYLAHQAEIDQAVKRVLESGWYILGQEVAAFEKEFAGYIGSEQAIGVANGTDALEIALRAVGIGPGDVVLTTAHTAVATAAAIEQTGAVPRFADIDLNSYTLDPGCVEDVLKQDRRIKAIVPVHLYGRAANLGAIGDLAEHYGVTLVEDCAQAHGAVLNGRRLGTFGRIAAFSFYPTKNLAAMGDGGIIVTADAEAGNQCRLLRQYGWKERYISDVPGMNSRLDELQAAILRVRLRYLDEENEKRRAIAERYNTLLQGLPGLVLPEYLDDGSHVYHQYVVRAARRDELQAALKSKGVGTLVHYPVPIHLQPAYRHLDTPSLPNTERAACEVLSLPMYPQLEQVERVAEVLAVALA